MDEMSSSGDERKQKRKRRSDEIREHIRRTSGIDKDSGRLSMKTHKKFGVSDSSSEYRNDRHKEKRRDRRSNDRNGSYGGEKRHSNNGDSRGGKSTRSSNHKKSSKSDETNLRREGSRRRSADEDRDRDDDSRANRHRETSANSLSYPKSSRPSDSRAYSKRRSQSPRRWSPSPSPTAPKRRHAYDGDSREARQASARGGERYTRDRGLEKGEERPERRRSHSRDRRHHSQHRSNNSLSESSRPEAGSTRKSSEGSELTRRSQRDARETRAPSVSDEEVTMGPALPPKASSSSSRKGSGKPGKKGKRGASTKLLSFGDDMAGDGPSNSTFQGLGAATEKEFKRSKRPAGGALDAKQTGVSAVADASEADSPVPVNSGRRIPVLGPSKISTSESRGQRPYQEDRHVVVSCLHSPEDEHSKFDACPPCFFAVYDGHNGDLASETAKSKFHTFVSKASPATGLRGEPSELLEGLLRAAFASTEEEILKEADVEGGRQDGTTVTACLLVGDLLVVGNVGDSQAVLGSLGDESKRRCRTISSNHTPADPLERARIEKAGGAVVFNGCYRVQHEDVNCRLAVSRSLGDPQFKRNGVEPQGGKGDAVGQGQLVSPEPAVKSLRLTPQDRVIVVASDGLWDVMTGLEAVDIALTAHARAPSSTGRAPSWADALTNGGAGGLGEADPANALVREAIKRGTADNVTAVVAILPWD